MRFTSHGGMSAVIGLTARKPSGYTAMICENFGYDAFIVQRGAKIPALPAIGGLGKNTSWGTDIESRNVCRIRGAAEAHPRHLLRFFRMTRRQMVA